MADGIAKDHEGARLATSETLELEYFSSSRVVLVLSAVVVLVCFIGVVLLSFHRRHCCEKIVCRSSIVKRSA